MDKMDWMDKTVKMKKMDKRGRMDKIQKINKIDSHYSIFITCKISSNFNIPKYSNGIHHQMFK